MNLPVTFDYTREPKITTIDHQETTRTLALIEQQRAYSAVSNIADKYGTFV